jgi:hypothetical protein
MTDPDHDHWLVQPAIIRRLWAVYIAVLVILVALDLVVAHDAHFGIDGTSGFGAWYGFLSCVGLVLFAKSVGGILKRPDTYYDR